MDTVKLLIPVLVPLLFLLLLKKIFGRQIALNGRSKIVAWATVSSTAILYLLFVLLDLSFELGPVANLGLFETAISDGLLLTIGTVLPVAGGILLIISLKRTRRLLRILFPVCLVAVVLVCDFVFIPMALRVTNPIDIDPGMCPNDRCLKGLPQ